MQRYACTGGYIYFSYCEIFSCSPPLHREGLEDMDLSLHINYNKYQEYRDMPAQEAILILVTVKSFSVVFHYTERALKKWTFPCTYINYKSIC
jgi:hypothetical protein